jgi:alpha-beta hydrolase superfamily lysophospholipase
MECNKVPDSVAAQIDVRLECRLPSAQGQVRGVFFFPKQAVLVSQEIGHEEHPTEDLVILLSGLGQHGVDGNWLWIQHLLGAGKAVLALSLDGHEKAGTTLFDPRLSTRTLPLVLERLARIDANVRFFVAGHGYGATVAWLAACRQDASQLMAGVCCLAPWIQWDGGLESRGCVPPFLHPVQLIRDGIRLSSVYGLVGMKKLWQGDNVRDLRKRLFVGSTLESQMASFFSEIVDVTHLMSQAKVPVLVVLPGRGIKSVPSVSAGSNMSGCVQVVRDPVRTARGIQFADEWPAAAVRFFGSCGQPTSSGDSPCL